MAVISAGVLAWRRGPGGPQVLLVHPGGPYWAKKDVEGWSIPKGLIEPGEDGWAAAQREFEEELGQPITGDPHALTPHTASGKTIHAWLVEADLDVSTVVSNTFEIEWPPRSGKRATFPEVDRAEWFDLAVAATKIHKGQRPILAEAIARVLPSPGQEVFKPDVVEGAP